jgi:hypothetical protein
MPIVLHISIRQVVQAFFQVNSCPTLALGQTNQHIPYEIVLLIYLSLAFEISAK